MRAQSGQAESPSTPAIQEKSHIWLQSLRSDWRLTEAAQTEDQGSSAMPPGVLASL